MEPVTFKQTFQIMCQENYPQGATLMEVFMTLNNSNMTLNQVQEFLDNLHDQGYCKVLHDQTGTVRYLYQEPMPFKCGTDNGGPSDMDTTPSGAFLNNFLQTYQKSETQLKQTFQQGFQQMLEINKQMMEQQKAILSTLQTMNKGAQPMDQAGPASAAAVAPTTAPPAVSPWIVKVKSFTGDHFYTLDMKKKTCDCPDFMFHQSKIGGMCKHLKTVVNNSAALQMSGMSTN